MKGRIVTYDRQESRSFKQLVAYSALPFLPKELLDGPLVVTLDICRSIPKSFNTKKTQLAVIGMLRPTSKPDCSNYLKGVEDALNKVVWRDDSQIVTLTVRKWYSNRPRTIVKIEKLEETEKQSPPADD